MRNHTILTTSPNSQVTGEICIANGDGCDPFEELPLPWDQSWESTVSVAGLSLGATGGSDPAQIIQRHSAFVDGMANVYDILLSLRYLTPPGVQKPPHVSPKSAVAAAKLNSLGLEPENVELMRHLPYLTGHAKDRRVTGHHFELARESLGQSYLEDAPDDELRHARDPLGLYKNDIPPWAFRLTIGWRGGTNYIYDTKDRQSNSVVTLRLVCSKVAVAHSLARYFQLHHCIQSQSHDPWPNPLHTHGPLTL